MTTTRTMSLTPPIDLLRRFPEDRQVAGRRVENERNINREVRQVLIGVARKLKERQWRRVYWFPTGHPALSMNIKLLVYRARMPMVSRQT